MNIHKFERILIIFFKIRFNRFLSIDKWVWTNVRTTFKALEIIEGNL